MVTINKIVLAGALAAFANAVPMAEAQPIAFANAHPITKDTPKPHTDGYSNKTMARDTLEDKKITKGDIPESYNVTKRADIAIVPDLGTLLSQSTDLLGEGLKTILGIDVSSGSDQIATLLTNINSYLDQVETAIKNYVPATGVGSEIQNLVVKTGLQSLVFSLSSLVGTLATLLLQGSNQPQILAQIKELYSHIEAISNASGKFSLLGTLGDIVHSILSIIAKILESI
jgi:hypothetical protein